MIKLSKYIILLLFGCILNACSNGYSVFNAYIEKQYPRGGEIRNHYMSSSNLSDINSLANDYCRQRGISNAKVTNTGAAGEFQKYSFTCQNISTKKNRNKQHSNKKLDLKIFKQECEILGFKPDTEKFGDCVLNLSE